MKVLVVEHEESARENLCGDLARVTFVESVRSADSEEAAERILSHYAPDVIFLGMQLPDRGAFRIADRSWQGNVPYIVCVTTFDRPLLAALSFHRAEYVVRPVGAQELVYLITRGRRPDPVSPEENLRRILEVALSLSYPVRSRIRAFRQGRSFFLNTKDVAAVRYDRGKFRLWTQNGVYETPRPLCEIRGNADASSFLTIYRNALISTDRGRFGRDLERARWWLRRCALLDFVLGRPVVPG